VIIVGISGSTRRGSFNSALLRAAAAAMPAGAQLRIESIAGIPLYNGDEEAAQGKPVAIAGASPGGFGTVLSQNAWLPVFKTLGANLWSGSRLLVSRAGTVFDAQGDITDAGIRDSLAKFLAGFVAYVSLVNKVHAGAQEKQA
jgi:chromate reductase, NAD(P)H dehydrogenase (quinone)